MAIGIYKCLYDFTAQLESDLTIYSGDIIKVTKQINSDWLAGIANNKEGQFPCSYAERKLHNLPDKVGVVLNNFSAEQDGDLTIKKGDVVGIIENVDANWLRGFTNTGRGIFPAKFIKEVDFSRFSSVASTPSSSRKSNGGTPTKTKANSIDNKQNVEKKNIPWAKAIDNFQAQDADEITITKGDEIELVKEIDNFWIVGIVKGKQGKFPKEFINVVHDLPALLKSTQNTNKDEENSLLVPQAKATHMFVGENSNELSFDKGDTIILVEHFNKDWMKGKIGKSVGLFPVNHVKILVDLPYTEKTKPNAINNGINIDTKSKLAPSSNGHSTDNNKKAPPQPQPSPSPSRVSNGVSSKEQKNVKNYFPIPPTMYPKPGTDISAPPSPSITKPPEVKRRSFKKKQGIKKPTVETQELTTSDTSKLNSPAKSQAPLSPKPQPLTKKPQSEATISKFPRSNSKTPQNTGMAEFELTQERVSLDVAYVPKPPILPRCPTDSKPPLLPRCPTNGTSKVKAPPRPEVQTASKLQKPLVPVPASPSLSIKDRPLTLDVKSKSNSKNDTLTSPVAMVNSKTMAVAYRKDDFDTNSLHSATSFKKESNDSIDSRTSHTHFKAKTSNSKINVDERDFKKKTNELMCFDSPAKSSLSSSSTMSPARRLTIESNKNIFGFNGKILPSPQEEIDAIDSYNSIELKRIEARIVEIKVKIEAEAHKLSGVETLLDFVGEDRIDDLMNNRMKHNDNITELNEELNGLEDEKSSLLASFGKVEDMKHRVVELEKNIEKYLDNCEQLRRMQDVSVPEDLPEIRDSIDFCENMVDALLDELNGLREKLGELDEPDSIPDPEMQLVKQKHNQRKVIEELIHTEEKYINDLTITLEIMNQIKNQMNHVVNIMILFGNLPSIIELAKRLLTEFKSSNNDQMDEVPSRVATCFLDVATEMKGCYADYCRNYDDAQNLLEKYEENSELWLSISKIVEIISPAGAIANLQGYLIKPVQRVLKYPLLLAELLKNHMSSGLTQEVLRLALTEMTDVASAINEFKRRKDLVQKYRETDDGIGKKVQKLNWHSVAKKSSRINQRITQFTGLNSQTVDQTFGISEKRFRGLEKVIKSFMKNVMLFVEEFKENVMFVKQCSESIRQFYDDTEVQDEVIKYYSRIYVITEQYANNMTIFIQRHVTDPLNQILQLFQGPFRLIQKRHDKLLDYDRARNRAERAKDSKDDDKIKQTREELQMSENIYTALNAQLLEELPELCDKSSSFLQYCISNFVETYKRYLSSSYHQLYELWQLPFVSKDGEMFEVHQELINNASGRLSLLSFVPFVGGKDMTISKQPVTQTLSNQNRTSFFIDLDDSVIDPTSPIKPLIDFNGNDFDEIDKSNTVFGTNDWTRQEETKHYIVKYNFEAEDEVELSATEGTKVIVVRKSDKNGNTEWWYVDMNGKKGYIPQSYLVADKDALISNSNNKSKSMGHEKGRKLKIGNNKIHDNSMVACSDLPDPPLEFTQDLNNGNNDNNKNKSDIDLLTGDPPIIKNEKDISSQQSNTILNTTGTAIDLKNSYNSNYHKQLTDDVDYYLMQYNFEGLNQGELTVQEGELVKVIWKQDQKGNSEWWFVEYNGLQGYVPGDFLRFVNEVPLS